mmetsp:Transcript_31583/g.69594  ORF Transcript_31583/g.69594 Transcript_31583/m.69594 type:complete len:202 (+) Transcript_31583:527-1132(+)
MVNPCPNSASLLIRASPPSSASGASTMQNRKLKADQRRWKPVALCTANAKFGASAAPTGLLAHSSVRFSWYRNSSSCSSTQRRRDLPPVLSPSLPRTLTAPSVSLCTTAGSLCHTFPSSWLDAPSSPATWFIMRTRGLVVLVPPFPPSGTAPGTAGIPKKGPATTKSKWSLSSSRSDRSLSSAMEFPISRKFWNTSGFRSS